MVQAGSFGDDEFVRDRNGNIVRDRYGRPVRRRIPPATPPQDDNTTKVLRPDTPRVNYPPTPPRRPSLGESTPPRPSSYEQRPSGFEQRPTGWEERPGSGGYEARPSVGGYEPRPGSAPGGYEQRPADSYGQRPDYSATPPPRGGQYSGYPARPEPIRPQYQPPVAPPPPPGLVVTPQPLTPEEEPQPKRKRRQPRRRRGCGCGTLSMLLVVALVLSVVGVLWVDTQLTRVAALPATPAAKSSGTNWLIVGSDSRRGLSEEQINQLGTGGDLGSTRTDTIMVLHLPTTGQATLLSIPRDSYVSIDGYGMEKINAAFTYGGPQLLTTTVEQSTGLEIDHYLEVGFGGFAGIVDALGGVTMCLAEPIDDPLANINLPAGCQELNGPQALGYVRSRAFPRGDLDRVEHQREFLNVLAAEISKPSTWLNPFKLIPLVNQLAKSVVVGNGDHVWHLLRLAWAMKNHPITTTVPIGDMADVDVGSVLMWDENAAPVLFRELGANQ